MIKYESLTIQRSKDQPDKVVVENDTNTFKFYGFTMAEIADFMKGVLSDDETSER